MQAEHDLTLDQYRDLAEFRRRIRRFLHFSEQTAKEHGIEHHSAVELINRLENKGAIARQPGTQDKREVWIKLTATGRAILRKLALEHRIELERSGPELAHALNATLRHAHQKVVA